MSLQRQPAAGVGVLNFCDYVKSRRLNLLCIDCMYEFKMEIPVTMKVSQLDCPSCWLHGYVIPNDRSRR